MNEILGMIKSHRDAAFYYKNLATGETATVDADRPFIAASMIKLAVMAEAFRRFESGLDRYEKHVLCDLEKYPSCGVLSYMQVGIALPLIDLVTLMIIVSDNTATNILIDRLGIDAINETCARIGLKKTRLNRRLFDAEQAKKGIQNYVSARDIGLFFEKIYRGELISESASAEMLSILKNQRLNGKMPFYLSEYSIAHKTGEDSGISHDGGIIFAEQPRILCFLSGGIDVPAFERTIQHVSLAILLKDKKPARDIV